jgi:hypothetical protein
MPGIWGDGQRGGIFGARVDPEQIAKANKPYVRPGAKDFSTKLDFGNELAFRQWVADNQVPFDPDSKAPQDYDMRGFWQGLRNENPIAQSAVDPNDNRLHYPDYWKTPYHETFSNESQWATDMAPRWNEQDQLTAPSGRILFDDRRQRDKLPKKKEAAK